MATCGVVSPTGAHNNLSPPSSRAQSILWRAQHKPPTLSFMPLLRGRGLWGVGGCTGEYDVAGDVGWATCRRWTPTLLRDSPDHLNIGASCCWVDGGVPCWVEVRRAPCWPPSPGLVWALAFWGGGGTAVCRTRIIAPAMPLSAASGVWALCRSIPRDPGVMRWPGPWHALWGPGARVVAGGGGG